jgi:predicted SAM-dependent methyltransferase
MIEFLKDVFRPTYVFLKKQKGIFILKNAVRKGNMKIVIGAGGEHEKDWVPTDIDFLNLLSESDWSRFFQPGTIEMMVAEHVWEHLTPEESHRALKNCYTYLKVGGHIRIAVPDGNHSDPDYIEMVKPGGYGNGSDDHKVLYTISSLTELLEKLGFKAKGLEYFNEKHEFVYTDWNLSGGKIRRSRRFDPRNTGSEMIYSSLIVDATKE